LRSKSTIRIALITTAERLLPWMVRIIFPDVVAPPFPYAQSAVTSFGLGSDRRRSLLTAKPSQGASRCPNLMFVVNGSSSLGDAEGGGDCDGGLLNVSVLVGREGLSGIARMAAKMPANVPATIAKVPNLWRTPSGRQSTPAPKAAAAATTIDAVTAKESGGRTNSHTTSPIARSSSTPAPATRSQKWRASFWPASLFCRGPSVPTWG
jgi:hypothetical protein